LFNPEEVQVNGLITLPCQELCGKYFWTLPTDRTAEDVLHFDLPRSPISHVFFDVFLKIGEDGFTCVPGEPAKHRGTVSMGQVDTPKTDGRPGQRRLFGLM
jgi:hypothetical protein